MPKPAKKQYLYRREDSDGTSIRLTFLAAKGFISVRNTLTRNVIQMSFAGFDHASIVAKCVRGMLIGAKLGRPAAIDEYVADVMMEPNSIEMVKIITGEMEVPPKAKAVKATWRAMTDEERQMARALGGCRYGPGTGVKRFARSLLNQANAADPQITEKQAVAMWAQGWTFRKQITDRNLVATIIRKKNEAP